MIPTRRHSEHIWPRSVYTQTKNLAVILTLERSEREGSRKDSRSMDKSGYVYIMTNKRNTVLYTGVTSNLQKRIYEPKEKLVKGFTEKYNVIKLVYYETWNSIEKAIEREKQIKGWLRIKKEELISSVNSGWKDLYGEII